ncbi:MAG TPA: hypothetical protein VD859_03060 [Nocardioides sp.]|nr:hypothetical protein [Nocardioides sp.]
MTLEIVMVPEDFISALSDTRASGHTRCRSTAPQVWTDCNTSQNKVAEYWPAPGNLNADDVLGGESIHGGDWWRCGTLAEWEAAFADENVLAYGFSLGSGVLGDGVIHSMTFGGTAYEFGAHTVLTGKEQCKNGGWATSTMPVFKNQGDCVSFFASGK